MLTFNLSDRTTREVARRLTPGQPVTEDALWEALASLPPEAEPEPKEPVSSPAREEIAAKVRAFLDAAPMVSYSTGDLAKALGVPSGALTGLASSLPDYARRSTTVKRYMGRDVYPWIWMGNVTR